MHDSARIFSTKSQAIRAVNAGCVTTEDVAEYCRLTTEGAFVILKDLWREGKISRHDGEVALWLPKVKRPADDEQVYAPFAPRNERRRARYAERKRNNNLAVRLTQGESRRVDGEPVATAKSIETRLDKAGETAASF